MKKGSAIDIQHRSQLAIYLSLPILSWAFYDFANTIFSSNINTIFFPFYMDEVLGTNEVMQQVASTFISYANAIASLLLVIFSPLLVYGLITQVIKRSLLYGLHPFLFFLHL